MSVMLDVVIGLIFLFLLFSLLATTVMELIAGFLALRGRLLERAIEKILTTGYLTRMRPLWQELLNRLTFGLAFREKRPDPDELTRTLAAQIPDPPLVATRLLRSRSVESFDPPAIEPEVEKEVKPLAEKAATVLDHTMKKAAKKPSGEAPTEKVALNLLKQVELNYAAAATDDQHPLGLRARSATGEVDLQRIKEKTVRSFFLSDYFFHSPLYRQITRPEASPRPSYLSAEAFLAILLDFFSRDDPEVKRDLNKLRAEVEAMPDCAIKRSLLYLLDQSEGSLERFKAGVKNYYDEIMDHVTGWYKRHMQAWLLAVGLLIAMIFNANALRVYNRLSDDPELRATLVAQATRYVEQNRQLLYDSLLLNLDPADQLDSARLAQRIESLNSAMDSLIRGDLERLRSPLGLGWERGLLQPEWQVDPATTHWIALPPRLYFLYAIWDNLFGWLITALAICLGAPFWFDLLKKLVNIRNAPNPPDEKPPASYGGSGSPAAGSQPIVLPEGYEIRKKPVG